MHVINVEYLWGMRAQIRENEAINQTEYQIFEKEVSQMHNLV